MAHIFFDFDSTIVSVETLDLLALKHLKCHAKKQEIERITQMGMDGTIPLFESLNRRMGVAKFSKQTIEQFAESLPELITPKLKKSIQKLQNQGHEIHILSGGFKDYMQPTAKALNISKKNIHANNFVYDKYGNVTGLNKQNPLCQNGGKGQVISSLGVVNKAILIGDGYTDLEVYQDKFCQHFIGFGIHQARDIIKEKSPLFAETMEEFEEILNKLLTEK